jgi:F-type H+-transporting ATPase subunit delta
VTQALTLARPYARAAFGIARDEAAASSGSYAGWSQARGVAARVAGDPRGARRGGEPRRTVTPPSPAAYC